MNGEEQERAHTCSESTRFRFSSYGDAAFPLHVRLVGAGLTLTGLLSRFQAVAGGAHAGSGCGRGGQTQLGTVSIVVAAQIDSS